MNLWDIPAIDQHAHNLLKPEASARYPYSGAFTEGYDPAIVGYHARHTLCYRRSLREIAALLDCEPTEAAVVAQRAQLGLERLTELCFRASNLEAVFLDDGFLPDQILPLEWHRQFAPVRRLLRLEMLAQDLISKEEIFEAFLERFLGEIDPPPRGVVAFKSIAAYRTDLAIQFVSKEIAASSFYAVKQTAIKGTSLRLADKALIVSIYITLGIYGLIPGWLVILVVSRDIMIIGAVMLSWLVGTPVKVKPLLVSKLNTAAQIVFACVVLGTLGFAYPLPKVSLVLMALVAALTLLSVAAYVAEWVRHMNSTAVKK